MNDICTRCANDADDNCGGLCRECYPAEHGPSWDYPPSVGDDSMYRQNMIDAGRGHLVR